MGVGSGPKGQVFVTDMDRIELSNLSRQFLFRSKHLNKPKSVCAADVAREINPELKITCFEVKVCEETEDIFDDAFWSGLDGVWNALDNWKARQYTDFKCCLYKKPLLESGTEGTKTNSEIIIPHKTSTFNDNPDQGTGGIPMCTLQNFPYLIDHCIEWARPEFEELFDKLPTFVNDFLDNPAQFLTRIDKQDNKEEKKMMLSSVLNTIRQSRERTWENCLQLSYSQFVKQYNHRLKNLIQNFPEDARSVDPITKVDMGPFWSGHKRFPEIQNFNINTPSHFSYLFACSNLFAFSFGLTYKSEQEVRDLFNSVSLVEPHFDGKKINLANESDSKSEELHDDDNIISKLRSELAAIDVATVPKLNANEFEKDNDHNFHIDFVTIAANLRADNFHIKNTTRFQAKITAGRIIPALATTTAMVTGLVQLEFYKLVRGLALDSIVNCNINLAKGLEFFNFFEPFPPKAQQPRSEYKDDGDGNGHTDKYIAVPENWSRWNQIDVSLGDATVADVVEYLEEKYEVVVEMLGKYGLSQKDIDSGLGKALYNSTDALLPARKHIMVSKVSNRYNDLYGAISEKKSFILLDGYFTREIEGEEVTVEMPPIKINFFDPMEQ